MAPIELLKKLVDQIERCNPIDDHGHDFKMNQAFIEAKVAVRLATVPEFAAVSHT
jgi:hypothetical protein